MFLRSCGRSLGIALATILVSLLMYTYSSADYYLGYRTNGKLCNRYLLPPDLPVLYSHAYRDAIDAWREAAPSLRVGLQPFIPQPKSTVPLEMDKCYIETTRNPDLNGLTVPYVLKNGGLLPVYDSPNSLDPNKAWSRCVVYLYTNQIEHNKSRYERLTGTTESPVYTLAEWVEDIALHELGHTLKFPHPGMGTVLCALPDGESSVMRRKNYKSPPLTALQSYDEATIRRKLTDAR